MVMSAYELNNFIFMAARLPQILSNYKVRAHNCSASCSILVPNITKTWPHSCNSTLVSAVIGSDLGMMMQAKNTGQLSLITAFMSTAGCLARIFTSIQEGAGLSMVRGFCIGKGFVASY